MIPYFLVFATFFFASAISLDRKSKFNLLIPVWSVILIMFIGLRFESVDYYNYENIFIYVDKFEELSFPNYVPATGEKPTESLYSLIILLVKRLGGGFGWFVFIVAAISVGAKLIAFQRMSNSFYLSAALYVSSYMVNDLGQIRNGLSSGLVLLSVYYLHHQRKISFVCLVFSAALIHIAATLSLVLPVVKKMARPSMMFLCLISSVTIAVFGGAGMWIVDFIIGILGLGGEFRLVRYMSSQFAEKYSVFGGTLLLHLFTSIMLLMFRRRLIAINIYNSYFIPMYLYGTCMMLAFSDYGIILARIKDLFCIPASMIILPSFAFIVKSRYRLVAFLGLYFYAAVVFYMFIPDVPYKTLIFN